MQQKGEKRESGAKGEERVGREGREKVGQKGKKEMGREEGQKGKERERV